MSHVIVVGGGAAGMMAAYSAAICGHQVTLLEKNEKLGKKIYITGKGRCNVTNACDQEQFFKNIVTGDKFMYSSLYQFNNQSLMQLLEENGCPLKTERGDRVFPVSDHSSDVIRTFQKILKDMYVEVRLQTEVGALLLEPCEEDDAKSKIQQKVVGVKLKRTGEKLFCDAVILACGGLSYPSTGSTGDGYSFAKKAGMTIRWCRPALVPFEVSEAWCSKLQGLSLKNVSVKLLQQGAKKPVYEGFGEMLFTHFGVSGPLILTASSMYAKKIQEGNAELWLDLKPAMDEDTLDKRVLKDFEKYSHKAFKNAIVELFPAKLVPVMVELSGISEDMKVYDISREQRKEFVHLIKNIPMTVTCTRGFQEAIITQGGVELKDVNPSSMESKTCRNLFLAGEMLDIDAFTGGFNLQLAWSTGYLAGQSIPY